LEWKKAHDFPAALNDADECITARRPYGLGELRGKKWASQVRVAVLHAPPCADLRLRKLVRPDDTDAQVTTPKNGDLVRRSMS
jgi:hypothetical protein